MDESELLVDELELANLARRRVVGLGKDVGDRTVVRVERADRGLGAHGRFRGGGDLGVPAVVVVVEVGVPDVPPLALLPREHAVEAAVHRVDVVTDAREIGLQHRVRELTLRQERPQSRERRRIDALEHLKLIVDLRLEPLELGHHFFDHRHGLSSCRRVLREVPHVGDWYLGASGGRRSGEQPEEEDGDEAGHASFHGIFSFRIDREPGVAHKAAARSAAAPRPRWRRISSAYRSGDARALSSSRKR